MFRANQEMFVQRAFVTKLASARWTFEVLLHVMLGGHVSAHVTSAVEAFAAHRTRKREYVAVNRFNMLTETESRCQDPAAFRTTIYGVLRSTHTTAGAFAAKTIHSCHLVGVIGCSRTWLTLYKTQHYTQVWNTQSKTWLNKLKTLWSTVAAVASWDRARYAVFGLRAETRNFK